MRGSQYQRSWSCQDYKSSPRCPTLWCKLISHSPTNQPTIHVESHWIFYVRRKEPAMHVRKWNLYVRTLAFYKKVIFLFSFLGARQDEHSLLRSSCHDCKAGLQFLSSSTFKVKKEDPIISPTIGWCNPRVGRDPLFVVSLQSLWGDNVNDHWRWIVPMRLFMWGPHLGDPFWEGVEIFLWGFNLAKSWVEVEGLYNCGPSIDIWTGEDKLPLGICGILEFNIIRSLFRRWIDY